jgi:hypothetical protein
MAAVPSNMLPLGTIAPDFIFTDTISRKMIEFTPNANTILVAGAWGFDLD